VRLLDNAGEISNIATWFDEPAEMPTATASAPNLTASCTVAMVAS